MKEKISNKARTADKAQDSMLEEIKIRCDEVLGDNPQKARELSKKLAEAEAAEEEARLKAEGANSIDEFAEAVKASREASTEIKFLKKELDRNANSPRMSEEEYTQHRNKCKAAMDAANAQYRKEAGQLMDKLKAAQDELQEKADAINSTLVLLDEASNFLQSKYPCKETIRKDAPNEYTLDRTAWKKHALRYDYEKVHMMATQSLPEEREKKHEIHDSVLCNAWTAVAKGYPRRVF